MAPETSAGTLNQGPWDQQPTALTLHPEEDNELASQAESLYSPKISPKTKALIHPYA